MVLGHWSYRGMDSQCDCQGGGAGFVINLIVGIIGGFLGGWLVGLWGWIAVGTFGTLLTSVAGAIILLLIVSLFTRRRPEND